MGVWEGFAGRTAVVTGAGGGMGLEIARDLVAAGAHVIGIDLKDRPAGLAVTTHMCRGNFRSSWAAEGSYDFVAEALFSELAVDGFFLEYDDDRSGGFAPLRFVPPGKMVVLGLVTTKRGTLESKDKSSSPSATPAPSASSSGMPKSDHPELRVTSVTKIEGSCQ